jgi:hypothetical protein
MELQDLLQSAVLAARSGQRQTARALFLQVTERDPGCELAWLWLSELHEEPADRIHALQRALHIRPGNQRAAERLAKLHETYIGLGEVAARPPQPDRIEQTAPGGPLQPAITREALPRFDDAASAPFLKPPTAPFTSEPDELSQTSDAHANPAHERFGVPQVVDEPQDALTRAQRLAADGHLEPALSLLYQQAEASPQHSETWLLIAEITPRTQEKLSALRKAAEIEPNNEEIRAQCQRLEALERNPFLAGQQHEERGEREQARLVYEWIKVHSRSPADRIEAARRMENLRITEEAERLHPISPTLGLLRLTLGPAILFGLLIFIHSGLNPLKLPLLSLLGQASVLAGSLLVNVTGLRPMHPRWVELFGRPAPPKNWKCVLACVCWAGPC